MRYCLFIFVLAIQSVCLINHSTIQASEGDVYASQSEKSEAYALRSEALNDLKNGEIGIAQTKLIQAYELFVVDEEWGMASLCLYERAIEYMNIGDLSNLWQQAEILCQMCNDFPSAITKYNYHSVVGGYYAQVDSGSLAIKHGELAIQALEQIDNPRQYNIMPIWSYYNHALMYDMYVDTPNVDSIKYYLDKAREVIRTDMPSSEDSLEALISVVDLEAWLAYYAEDYVLAELMMQEVLELIAQVEEDFPNTIITERGEAYKFLTMLSEERGKWQEAYRYQQLVLDNNELRYNVDKRRVLQEVQTRYEVEKQQLEMDKLEAENKSNRWLIVAMWLLLIALVLGYWLLAMGRKNAESKLYEAALEADNMRQTISCLEAQTDVEPLRLLVDGLVKQLQESKPRIYTQGALARLQALDLEHIQVLLSHGKKITTMDKRYILCFAAGISVEDIADFMNLEPASVYTVRYRLRKKFGSEYPFPY